ncbi:hypothetical protein AYK20_03815 [Thermoplasmatales archaeon SG8-52-1]|nr:MAG: hypothetical protein AYK20_03815 [Thermoplasmatales archaeon SG8-52-1]
MEPIQKDVIERFVHSIYVVSSRRTTIKYAEETLRDALNSLKDQFELFKDVKIYKDTSSACGFQIEFQKNLSNLQTNDIANALESLIRLIYEDISEESGLYFITEIKNHLERKSVDTILGIGVNLDQIQREQHFKYARRKKKNQQKESGKKENPLGYTWKSVSNWEYNQESKQVILYDSNGNKLDEISLEKAIRSYVEKISGITELSPLDLENLLDEHEKSYSFLKLVYSENIDFETAKKMLNLSDKEIYEIIKNLIELKLLKYVSDDEIEITNYGKDFISK